MTREELQATFDQQAASYDGQWAKLAPLRDALNMLMGAVLSEIPADARILCVGSGTGSEILYLAERFPQWRFTAVEPSARMLEICHRRTAEQGIASRCAFHEGYLESLPPTGAFHAATSILVSQFVLEREARSQFFRTIAERLHPGGYLISADLSSRVGSADWQSLFEVWLRMMKSADVPPEASARLRSVYEHDVAVWPPAEVGATIASGGFESPIPFFQAGLIRAWYCRRAVVDADATRTD